MYTNTNLQFAIWKLKQICQYILKCSKPLWSSLLDRHCLVIWCVHVAYLHTLIKHQSLPFPWMERIGGGGGVSGRAINQSEESPKPWVKNRKVSKPGVQTVKIERQKQKGVENRLSKYEANPKPIVKVRKQVKNRRIAENFTIKTRQTHKNTNRTNRQNSQQRILEKNLHILHSSRHNCALLMM